ncbi:MAG: hypothetical protein K2V38_17920, partial [Gemmataceae bacterium]|nr:hypothetical protein [Gemmataceae bacterium]
MPPRVAVAGILVFWLATTGYVVKRDVWPRLFGSGAPPVAIELADEAKQNVPARWTILRNGQKVGRLTTLMKYHDATDEFQFTYRYTDLKLEQGGLSLVFSEVVADVRLTRAGDLKEEHVTGKAAVRMQELELFRAGIEVRGVVRDGVLTGRAELKNDEIALLNVADDLDPIPVPNGTPLNPMQPVNRLSQVWGEKRWVVHESNPLGESLGRLLQKKLAERGFKLPEGPKKDLVIAEVESPPQRLTWQGKEVECWVIVYRRAEPFARTCVQVKDGKVLRQEAAEKGESL